MKTASKTVKRSKGKSASAVRIRESQVFSDGFLRLKTVLVPIDFSEFSRRALAYAAEFARTTGAKLILLHVIESFPMDRFISPATLKNDNKERTAGAENELKALLEAFADERLIHGRQLVRTGKPYEEIIETARETKSEVIVLGSHGYTGIRRVYLGSTAERVVRHAPCHVLVVRE